MTTRRGLANPKHAFLFTRPQAATFSLLDFIVKTMG